MKVNIILINFNNEKFLITNDKTHKIIVKENELYLKIESKPFIKGETLIEQFNSNEECIKTNTCIKNILKRKKDIQETIQLIKKDIKKTKNEDEILIYKKFINIKEKELLKYDFIYIIDILKNKNRSYYNEY